MPDEKNSKITFTIRQKDQSEYKLPPGFTHDLSEEEQKFSQQQMENAIKQSVNNQQNQESAESQQNKQSDAIRKLEQYEKALEQSQVKEDSKWKLKVATFKCSFFLLLLLFVVAIAHLCWQHIRELEKVEPRPDSHEIIDLTTISNKEILDPSKKHEAKAESLIRQTKRLQEREKQKEDDLLRKKEDTFQETK